MGVDESVEVDVDEDNAGNPENVNIVPAPIVIAVLNIKPTK
jgi:hypothetical protein